jgi:hypothetical protein
MLLSGAERVSIFEHYIASKSFAAVREAFNNTYPDKEVPNKTEYTDWQQNFETQEVSVCDKCLSSGKTAEITAVPIPSCTSAATTG